VALGVVKMSPTDKFKEATSRNQDRAEPAEIWKARKFIRERLGEKISLRDVGKSVHISPNYLSEKFKRITGVNFVAYIAHARTEKARDLLQNSTQRISEIAFAVGFQSLSQFNRVFKKLSGKSPRAYRAAAQRGQPPLISGLDRFKRAASAFAKKRIEAPTSGTVENHEKENPAIHQREFAAIHDWEEFRLQCRHRTHIKREVGDRHLTACEKRRGPREQSKGH
jgi:AraC-like DNA-binding protein